MCIIAAVLKSWCHVFFFAVDIIAVYQQIHRNKSTGLVIMSSAGAMSLHTSCAISLALTSFMQLLNESFTPFLITENTIHMSIASTSSTKSLMMPSTFGSHAPAFTIARRYSSIYRAPAMLLRLCPAPQVTCWHSEFGHYSAVKSASSRRSLSTNVLSR